MANLARLKQQLEEITENFIIRLKRAKSRCLNGLPEVEFVKLSQDGLNFKLRKKFEGMTFFNLFE